MEKVTAGGLKTILSSCWYLNRISFGEDWMKVRSCESFALSYMHEYIILFLYLQPYMCDPQSFNGLLPLSYGS